MNNDKDKKNKHTSSTEVIKESQLINSLKICTEYTINIYKQISLSPKISDSISDVNGYCRNLQKMLKKFLDLLPKFTVSLAAHTKLKYQHDSLQQQYKKVSRQQKNYVCEMNVLEKRLYEAEKREQKLLQERKKDRRFTAEFQNKIQKIKKDSEDSIKKVIQISKERQKNDNKLGSRKNSLPTINSYVDKEKLSLMWLMDSPKKGPKTERLIQHLAHKY